MNLNNNRVNAAVPAADFTNIKTAIINLAASIEGVTIGLTAEERMALPKINVSNRAFVQDAINMMAATDADAFMPAFLKPVTAQLDLQLFDQMDQLFALLQPIIQRIADTRTLAGSEGYTTSLTFYKLAQSAAAAGIPGAQAIVDALQQRFQGQGGSGNSGGGTGE